MMPPPRPRHPRIRFSPEVALLEATGRADLAEVEKLLREGADPNSHNEDGLTPLHQVLSPQIKFSNLKLLSVPLMISQKLCNYYLIMVQTLMPRTLSCGHHCTQPLVVAIPQLFNC